MLFGDDHFETLLYDKNDESDDAPKWNQDLKKEEKSKLKVTIKSAYREKDNYWSKMHDKPGHALQDEVSRVFKKELERFYGLDKKDKEAWQKSDGFKNFESAI